MLISVAYITKIESRWGKTDEG